MVETFDHIFGQLDKLDYAIAKQKRINHKFVIFAVAMTVYVFVEGHLRRDQEEKIEKLTYEIKELKHVKGE